MPSRKQRSKGSKSVQLYNVSRELGIATDTIVAALEARGFELGDRLFAGDPNAKLAPEMYDALVDSYSDDAEAKARAPRRPRQVEVAESDERAPTHSDHAEARTSTGRSSTGRGLGRTISLEELQEVDARNAGVSGIGTSSQVMNQGRDSDEMTDLYSGSLSAVEADQIVTGTVVGLTDKEVVVDIGFESDGVVAKNEFGETPEVGDQIDVYVERLEDRRGRLKLSYTMATHKLRWNIFEGALESGAVIEGEIVKRIKGGMIVNLLGSEAFLPDSQVDVHPVRDFDAYIGRTMQFLVVKTNPGNGNVVISHKALIEKDLQEQRKHILDSLEVGQVLEGQVKNIVDFGAFVDLGGVDGLVHVSDLSWSEVGHPSEVLVPGQTVEVVVLDYSEERQQVSLGYKQLFDPSDGRPTARFSSDPPTVTESRPAPPPLAHEFRSAALFVRLTNNGARQLLGLLDPEAVPPDDDRSARLQAASALASAVGRTPTAYLSLLAEIGRDTGWPMIALRLPREGARAVDLRLARKERCLLVVGARATKAGKYIHELEVSPRLHVGVDSATPIPAELLAHLNALPTREEREAEVDARLTRWTRYLEVEQRHAEAERFAVPYTALHRPGDAGRIRIEIDPRTPADLLARVAACSRGDQLYLTRRDEGPDADGRGGRRLAHASVRSYDAKSRRLMLDLNDADADSFRAGRLQIPEEGLVVNSAAGSLAMIHRQQSGIRRLALHGGAHPDLDRILFGGNDDLPLAPFPPVEPIPSEECLDPARINERQRLAVALALATPDCLFLQGPPGTGKTTVIAELCYQLAKRGKRVLVASQANLAVDNALSRLQHSRDILAVRLGPSDKVEEDAQEFVGDRAVGRWLRSVKDHARARSQGLQRHLDAKAWFGEHGKALAAWADGARRQRRERAEHERLASEADQEGRLWREEAEAAVTRAAHLDVLADALSDAASPSDAPPSLRDLWGAPPSAEVMEAYAAGLSSEHAGANNTAPWDAEAALERERSALPDVDAIIEARDDALSRLAEVTKALDAVVGAQRETAALGRQADVALRTAEAATEAAAEAEVDRDTWREFIRDLERSLDAPVLGTEWMSVPAASAVADGIRDRLHRLRLSLTVADVTSPRVPHPDLGALCETWVRLERDGRAADAERALTSIEAAISDLMFRAARPYLGFLHLSRFEQASKTAKSAASRLLQDLAGPNGSRFGVFSAVRDERRAFLDDQRETGAVATRGAEEALKHAEAARREHQRAESEREQSRTRTFKLRADASAALTEVVERCGPRAGVEADLAVAMEGARRDPSAAYARVEHVFRSAARAVERRRDELDAAAVAIGEAWGTAARAAREGSRRALATAEQAEIAQAKARDGAAEHRRRAEQLAHDAQEGLELWAAACAYVGAEPSPEPPTAAEVGAVRDEAVGPASDPERLDRVARLLGDWVERLDAGGEVGRELTAEFHRRANVVGVTCAHAGKKGFYEGAAEYDAVIVDEVSKATPTELLLPALLGKRVVLVGDHRQLAPIFGQEASFEEAAAELGVDGKGFKEALRSSLFKERYEHLASLHDVGGDDAPSEASRAVMLTTQYRMHSHIMAGVNQFYDDQLELGHIEVNGRSVPLDTDRHHGLACPPWLSPDDHLVWIDTPVGGEWGHTQDGPTRFNAREVDVVARVLDALVATDGGDLGVGVTSVYASQVRKLSSTIDKAGLDQAVRDRLRISTVDKFQGMERDIMVVSLVLNGHGVRLNDFLRSPERVNVAMSRARRLLVIVGSSHNYCELTGADGPYARFYDAARIQGRIVPASLVLHA